MSVPIDPSVGYDRALLLFQEELGGVRTDADLQALRTRWVGRKGSWVAAFMDLVGRASPEEKRAIGRQANELKKAVESAIAEREAALAARRRPAGAVDVTLRGRAPLLGYRHPISLVREQVQDIFTRLGYQVLEGPEVEDDYHNFEALNMPAEHPARDMQDTLYLSGEVAGLGRPATLLRTHTSPMQIRYMETHEPPVRIIVPGKVYRRDDLDLTHTPMFQQVEGLVVGDAITMADLKGTLTAFARELFEPDTKVQIRPSFFPYTEPSAEVFIGCVFCHGSGCPICKRTGWLEIGGSGMVHPAVFESVGYDPDRYSGFAFGMGIERIAILKYGVDDIRLFYENDLRFLEQFPL